MSDAVARFVEKFYSSECDETVEDMVADLTALLAERERKVREATFKTCELKLAELQRREHNLSPDARIGDGSVETLSEARHIILEAAIIRAGATKETP